MLTVALGSGRWAALLLGAFLDWHSFHKDPGERFIVSLKPGTHLAKVILQMVVGIGAAAYIGWYAYQYLTSHHTGFGPGSLKTVSGAVYVIAFALAIAAGIELAYTLFTPGPDEALDPLMLGISSGILLLVTTSALPPLLQFFGVLLGVLALGALFLFDVTFLIRMMNRSFVLRPGRPRPVPRHVDPYRPVLSVSTVLARLPSRTFPPSCP